MHDYNTSLAFLPQESLIAEFKSANIFHACPYFSLQSETSKDYTSQKFSYHISNRICIFPRNLPAEEVAHTRYC